MGAGPDRTREHSGADARDESTAESSAELELGTGRRRSGGKGAYDEPGAGREAAEAGSDQVPELTAYAVADHGARRRRARPRSRHAGGVSRRHRPDRSGRPRGARPARFGPLPPVRPRPARSVAAKSERRRNRAPAGSTPVRPRAASDPWPGGRPGWRDRRGCASAGGTRGSSPADGCSAGRCACSLVGSRTTVWSGGNVPSGCLSQGGEPTRPASVGRPRRNEKHVDSMDTRQRPS